MKVRCNWCGAEFDEEDIILGRTADEEYCPVCETLGCLMNLPETPEDYKILGQEGGHE